MPLVEVGMPSFTLESNVGGVVVWKWVCPGCHLIGRVDDVMTTRRNMANPPPPSEVACGVCNIRFRSVDPR